MVAAPIPPDEEERLHTLYSYDVLDTMEEQSFDDVCQVAATLCSTPIALITLLDRRRQWFKARVGLDVREFDRDSSFCAHALVQENDLLVVHDAFKDPRFMDGPLVLNAPRVRFYSGVVLHAFDGKRLGTICVIDHVARDLTEEQRERLRALARQVEALLELRRTKRRLQGLLQQREQLARFVIHDLNNPLAALILNTEALLSDEDMRPDTRRGLEQICDQLMYVNRLVKNFQDVAATGNETVQLRAAEVRLPELVEDVLCRIRPSAHRLGIDVVGAFDRDLEQVWADSGLLERIVDNLLHNALSFAPQGSEITVEVRAQGAGDWRLVVRDLGRGVPERDRERIFEPYVRAGEQRLRAASRGLGLAFCRMAVEAHGGRIWVEPNRPQGSAFVVELPRSRPS